MGAGAGAARLLAGSIGAEDEANDRPDRSERGRGEQDVIESDGQLQRAVMAERDPAGRLTSRVGSDVRGRRP